MKIKWFSFIRILGLVWVLLYHFFGQRFSGGFLGVDIFFTFSGYLITAILIDEFAKNKKIDLLRFVKRRFYRIFPPLVFMILLVTPLLLFLRNDFRANIGQQIASSLGFVTNYFEILTGSSYETQGTPHLFVHTWSLALEVHFYLIWASFLFFISKTVKKASHLQGMAFLTSGVVTILSFLSMFIASFLVKDFSRIYYSSWTHIFPFFIGAALATLVGVQNTTTPFKKLSATTSTKSLVLTGAGALAIEVFLLLFFRFTSIWTYLFGFLFSSLATATLIVICRVLHDRFASKKEPVFVTLIADTSYGIYLFHWPLFIIFKQLFGATPSVILTLPISIVLSICCFYILEPFLAGKDGRLLGREISLKPYTKWVWGLTSALALFTIGIALLAPRIGANETDIIVNNLKQADTKMQETMAYAIKGKASSFEVEKGETIIGDSVTLRAIVEIQNAFPNASIDAQESRTTEHAYEVLKTNIANGVLKEDVVIATGVNTISNYEEVLDAIVEVLPNGHHLIFVTPYDGTYSDPISEYQTQYVYELAKKYDYVTVADWNKISKDNPQLWTGTDYVHYGSEPDIINEGSALYTKTIQNAIENAQNKPVKNVAPTDEEKATENE